MQAPRLRRLRGQGKTADPLWAIALSLTVASVLTVYPVSYAWVNWRPLWMLMVTLFWVLCQPKWCGVWFAFFVGLSCDLMLDAQLGQHALSFVLVAFAGRYVVQNRRILTFAQLWLLAAAGTFVHLCVMLVLQKMAGQTVLLQHWLAWLGTVALWPLLVYGLRRWRT